RGRAFGLVARERRCPRRRAAAAGKPWRDDLAVACAHGACAGAPAHRNGGPDPRHRTRAEPRLGAPRSARNRGGARLCAWRHARCRGTAMTQTSARLDAVIAAIDEANARDPNRLEIDGRSEPAELGYGRRMSETLARLAPPASEHLPIAVRGPHIERWTSPRPNFPE